MHETHISVNSIYTFMRFPGNLTDLMQRQSVTQEQLAVALKVSQATVSRWENGETKPHPRHLRRIAQYFGISEGELLAGDAVNTPLRAAVALADKIGGTPDQRQKVFDVTAERLVGTRSRERSAERKLQQLREMLAQMLSLIDSPEEMTAKKNLPADSARIIRKTAKAKRAHATDLSWVSLDAYECSGGQPLSPARQPIGQVRVPKCYDLPGAFVLRINGDSMNAAKLKPCFGGSVGIQSGDRVVMQWVEHREAREHDIVAACVAGCCTLKRLRGSEGARWLEPESTNPDHRRIDLNDASPGLIQAVMIGKI